MILRFDDLPHFIFVLFELTLSVVLDERISFTRVDFAAVSLVFRQYRIYVIPKPLQDEVLKLALYSGLGIYN
jgi:hypothetical protein